MKRSGSVASPSDSNAWLRADGGDVLLSVHVQPGARRSEIVGLHGAPESGVALKIRLAAAPVEGQANAALLAFVAGKLGTRAAAISLMAGERSRAKRLRITGTSAERVRAALLPP